jgi:hypothetical protein
MAALHDLRVAWATYPAIQTDAVQALGEWLAEGAPSPDMVAARDALRAQLRDGESVKCPCCSQVAKVHKRSIHATMAAQLIGIYRVTGGSGPTRGWVTVGDIYREGASGDYAKLRFWGLIESRDTRTRTRNASGEWRITDAGVAFVEGHLAVPKYVYVYNNRKIGEGSSEKVTIHDALADKFDYAALMR